MAQETTTETRYRVVADLTEEEYHQHQELAKGDSERYPPLLEMTAVHGGRHFTEDRIPLFVHDAIVAVHGETNGTADADPYDANRYNTQEWPFEKKVRLMEFAAEGWNHGGPDQGESSGWERKEVAARMLLDHPEILGMFE